MWIFTCFVFLVMRKHANPWPIHALDAKKYLQKATFLKICEKNTYRVFIKNCVFSFKFCDFSELCQFCCSAGFLPVWCVCTHTDTEGKQSSEYLKKNRKNHNI